MTRKGIAARIGLGMAAAGMLAAAGYATSAGLTWLRYGHPAPPGPDESDPLLDRFVPQYEIVERHHIRVQAPAETTLAAAIEMDLQQSRVVRAIFKGREVMLGATPSREQQAIGLVALTKELGWGVLAEVPGREIVMGAVTQPWKADVVFRALPPEEFAAFNDPGFVKIAWTLRADPQGPRDSRFLTETRVVTTDAISREKFRRYWSRVSPGVILIRWMSLRLVRRDAERRATSYREAGRMTETIVPPASGA